jgi:hypothetical protein
MPLHPDNPSPSKNDHADLTKVPHQQRHAREYVKETIVSKTDDSATAAERKDVKN